MLVQRLRTTLTQSPALTLATLLIIIGGGLDILTTVTLVNLPGVHEENPVARTLLHHGGGLALVGLKLAAVLFGVGVSYPALTDRVSTETILTFVFTTMGVIWLAAGINNMLVTGTIPILGT